MLQKIMWLMVLLAVPVGLVVSVSVTTNDASAYDSPSYQWTYDADKRHRGYEGYAGVGPNAPYCSYWRMPKRKCTKLKSCKKRCRTVGWTVTENCG